MKKKALALATAIAACSSAGVYAAGVEATCADSKISVIYEVAENESCTAQIDQTLNGATSSEEMTVNSASAPYVINLAEGDSASVSAKLSCSNTEGGSASVSSSVSTTDGCSGTSDDDSTMPELPELPDELPETDMPETDVTAELEDELNALLTSTQDRLTDIVESLPSNSRFASFILDARLRFLSRSVDRQLSSILNNYEMKLPAGEADAAVADLKATIDELFEAVKA